MSGDIFVPPANWFEFLIKLSDIVYLVNCDDYNPSKEREDWHWLLAILIIHLLVVWRVLTAQYQQVIIHFPPGATSCRIHSQLLSLSRGENLNFTFITWASSAVAKWWGKGHQHSWRTLKRNKPLFFLFILLPWWNRQISGYLVNTAPGGAPDEQCTALMQCTCTKSK